MRYGRGASGFTLVELLVAISLLAVVSGMAYRGLDQILSAQKRIAAEQKRWSIDLALNLLVEDLSQMARRPVRIGKEIEAALAVKETVAPDLPFDAQLKFTRHSPLDTSGSLSANSARVGYRIVAGNLERMMWYHLDFPSEVVPDIALVLDQVAAIRLRYMDPFGIWQNQWSVPVATPLLPRAVELTLGLQDGITITRTVVIPAGFWSP